MERKLTYDEIVKTVECCFRLGCGCVGCPFDGETDCLRKAREAILDLINSQKAEIAELEAEIDKQYEQAKADILGNMADGGTSCHWCIDQHRAEAIKEFAERVKKDFKKPFFCNSKYVVAQINRLVKEMTEAADGKL